MEPRGARARPVRVRFVLPAIALLACLPALAWGAAAPRAATPHRVRAADHNPPLVFGIYPGGAAGAVGAAVAPKPDNRDQQIAALEQLRGTAPFVLHLYAGYTGAGSFTAAQQVGDEIAAFTARGFDIELVLTYRPQDAKVGDVPGYVAFVRDAVSAFGPNSRVVALQVTNEANVGGAPAASDGYYAKAKDALVAGVVAAKQAAVSAGFTQLRIGFNWAYESRGQDGFWRYLRHAGGSSFSRSVDWVGLDAYPGTWSPLGSHALAAGVRNTMVAALAALRRRYLPQAGIGPRVPIHVAENGYPTGPQRTPQMQASALRAAVQAVNAVRATYNVSDYRWFDLRDADSESSSFESQYGLLRDDYSPKPAFAVYRQLVGTLGGSGS